MAASSTPEPPATPAATGGGSDPIDRCLDRWHEFLRAGDPDLLDDLLRDDCTFVSPIVFTPQEGKEVTKLYLTAAGSTLGGGSSAGTSGNSAGDGSPGEQSSPPKLVKHPSGDEWDGRFRYVRTVHQGYDAVLEFETTLAGTYVNGVDMITCDDDGLIIDFKVMVRPLQAVNTVHEAMKAMLERISSPDAGA